MSISAPERNPAFMNSTESPSVPPDLDDIALMLRVKVGDLEAFEILVERHQHSVVGTAAKMLGGEADAEDVAQHVFVRVWKSAPRYEPSAKFTTWLMTITRNLVFNEMRRRQRAKFIPIDAEPEDGPPLQFEDTEAMQPNEELLNNELKGAIEKAIASLPENQRTAIVLRRFENMPYEDIAKVLKTSVPAVKSILFRARAELKEALKRYLE
ncbi:RNA polymerase sigma factor RpoE [soil metagenome]